MLAAFAQLLERPWLIAAGLAGLIGADIWPAATAVVLIGVGGFHLGARATALRRPRLDPLALAMLEAVPEPMALSAADGTPVAMNQAWYDAFGTRRITAARQAFDNEVCVEETLVEDGLDGRRAWCLRHVTRPGATRPVARVSWAAPRPVAADPGAAAPSQPPSPSA